MKTLISSEDTPIAAGPYSPGLSVGEWIFLSGQGGFDPTTGKIISDDIAEQTAQTFRNIEVLLGSGRVARQRGVVSRAPHRPVAVRGLQRDLREEVHGHKACANHCAS